MLLLLPFWIFPIWWSWFYALCKCESWPTAIVLCGVLFFLHGMIIFFYTQWKCWYVQYYTLGGFSVRCLPSSTVHWYLSQSWILIPSFDPHWFLPAVYKWKLNIFAAAIWTLSDFRLLTILVGDYGIFFELTVNPSFEFFILIVIMVHILYLGLYELTAPSRQYLGSTDHSWNWGSWSEAGSNVTGFFKDHTESAPISFFLLTLFFSVWGFTDLKAFISDHFSHLLNIPNLLNHVSDRLAVTTCSCLCHVNISDKDILQIFFFFFCDFVNWPFTLM